MVDRKVSKGAAVPPGWELSDGRMLARKIQFPSAHEMSLYVLHVLVLTARARVGWARRVWATLWAAASDQAGLVARGSIVRGYSASSSSRLLFSLSRSGSDRLLRQ
mgnify:CR=1 FL=1